MNKLKVRLKRTLGVLLITIMLPMIITTTFFVGTTILLIEGKKAAKIVTCIVKELIKSIYYW